MENSQQCLRENKKQEYDNHILQQMSCQIPQICLSANDHVESFLLQVLVLCPKSCSLKPEHQNKHHKQTTVQCHRLTKSKYVLCAYFCCTHHIFLTTYFNIFYSDLKITKWARILLYPGCAVHIFRRISLSRQQQHEGRTTPQRLSATYSPDQRLEISPFHICSQVDRIPSVGTAAITWDSQLNSQCNNQSLTSLVILNLRQIAM